MLPQTVLLRSYMEQTALTDILPQKQDLRPIILGLFGEVGSIMAAAKKMSRENIPSLYQRAITEELGDILWYYTAFCRRLGYQIDDFFSRAVNNNNCRNEVAASDLIDGAISHVSITNKDIAFEDALLKLGSAVAPLLSVTVHNERNQELLQDFAIQYIQVVQASGVSFANIVRANIKKACSRFSELNYDALPTFDKRFPKDEQLPDDFKIKIIQRASGKSYLQWNDVFIGDPIADNIINSDHYRFHDVFHLAHAAILHWSPTFRALIKRKRKSDRSFDNNQDGGRAIVVEEGLIAWVFSCAKDLNFFEGHEMVSFDILKTIHKFVHGYEVAACPLKLWERAILDGYKVFRQVRKNNGGIIIGDRSSRKITYQPITRS